VYNVVCVQGLAVVISLIDVLESISVAKALAMTNKYRLK
jgi:hypothetical protein